MIIDAEGKITYSANGSAELQQHLIAQLPDVQQAVGKQIAGAIQEVLMSGNGGTKTLM